VSSVSSAWSRSPTGGSALITYDSQPDFARLVSKKYVEYMAETSAPAGDSLVTRLDTLPVQCKAPLRTTAPDASDLLAKESRGSVAKPYAGTCLHVIAVARRNKRATSALKHRASLLPAARTLYASSMSRDASSPMASGYDEGVRRARISLSFLSLPGPGGGVVVSSAEGPKLLRGKE
jgi:hypothetical protein